MDITIYFATQKKEYYLTSNLAICVHLILVRKVMNGPYLERMFHSCHEAIVDDDDRVSGRKINLDIVFSFRAQGSNYNGSERDLIRSNSTKNLKKEKRCLILWDEPKREIIYREELHFVHSRLSL